MEPITVALLADRHKVAGEVRDRCLALADGLGETVRVVSGE